MSQTNPYAGQLPGWRVINQLETTGPDQSGRYVRGKQITAALNDGTSFSVFVADYAYNVENVKAALADAASKVHAINKLSS